MWMINAMKSQATELGPFFSNREKGPCRSNLTVVPGTVPLTAPEHDGSAGNACSREEVDSVANHLEGPEAGIRELGKRNPRCAEYYRSCLGTHGQSDAGIKCFEDCPDRATPIDRVSARDLTPESLYRRFFRTGLPVVIIGALDPWRNHTADGTERCCADEHAAKIEKHGHLCTDCGGRDGEWKSAGPQWCGAACKAVVAWHADLDPPAELGFLF